MQPLDEPTEHARTKTGGQPRKPVAIAKAGFLLASLVAIGVISRGFLRGVQESARRKAAEQLVGKQAPHFVLHGENGLPVTETDLKGSIYVLDLGQSIPWGGQGAANLRKLEQYTTKHWSPVRHLWTSDDVNVFAIYNADALRSLGVAYPGTVAEFIRANRYNVRVLTYNPDENDVLPQTLGPAHETIVVGREGTVIDVLFNANYDNDVEGVVTAALRGGASLRKSTNCAVCTSARSDIAF